ncbi:hypothetical protein Pcinc_003587 [Petrolisthes cinctipes]|uniref:Uncharacterized protein n=1 Tax=Petrolisthes cinctipes TaxID=88211 RepID=A0AAE1L126_PETCI|nr:hypothetical protein Pcinc_003587 [Petrolisthes cinctipes]
MSIVKGSNSQLQQDRANLKKEKRNLPFSSSSSSSSENEDDYLPPTAKPASSLPSPQLSPSPPPYSPATYSVVRSLSPSPFYLPTPILNPSQGSSEERCLPASPSAIHIQLRSHPCHHNLSLRQLLQLLPQNIPAEPDSPPDPAAITYYAPPGASFIFQNESEILLFWAGAGYGKFVCFDYNQRTFKLAFPRQLEIFTTFLDLCSHISSSGNRPKTGL